MIAFTFSRERLTLLILEGHGGSAENVAKSCRQKGDQFSMRVCIMRSRQMKGSSTVKNAFTGQS